MLRYALRRMLWLFPSVLGVSLVSFFLLSLVPPPPDDAEPGEAGELEQHKRHRTRFLDLPLFLNVNPKDVRARASEALAAIGGAPPDGPEGRRAVRELRRLGGAALPVVLGELDGLPPSIRSRVALALEPVAARMGLGHERELADAERAVVVWNRFWETRSAEFRDATAKSAVRRYLRYGTEARAAEIRVLDTFALPVLMDVLQEPTDMAGVDEARRVIELVAHATGSDDRIASGDDVDQAQACVQRWRRWWMVYQADYVRLIGAERVAAFALETRYGKWVFESVVLRLGRDARGRPLLVELWARARVTFSVMVFGLMVAYLLAIPLGAISALIRGSVSDRVISAILLLLHALSPAVLATIALALAGPLQAPVGWAGALLGLVLAADPMRQQRDALLPELASDHMRAALARGAGWARLLFIHGLRHALLPVATRAALELPMALSACFVLEHLLSLRGLGAATVEAVREGDTSWLMALTVTGAAWAVSALVLNDAAYALLDPRMRDTLLRLRGRRG